MLYRECKCYYPYLVDSGNHINSYFVYLTLTFYESKDNLIPILIAESHYLQCLECQRCLYMYIVSLLPEVAGVSVDWWGACNEI